MILNLTGTTPVKADLGKRKMRGVAVPWNVDATVSGGQRVRFLPGSVDLDGVPVVLHHDDTQPIGRVIDSSDNGSTLDAVASISEVHAGDEALVLASDGVLTGWSVGVEPTEFTEEGDVLVIAASTARHLALVTVPAFADARVAEVAASAAPADPEPEAPAEDKSEEDTVTDTKVEETPAPVVVASAPRIHTSSAPLPTVGEWLYASINRRSDATAFAAMEARVKAASPHTFVADVPGLIPKAIVGEVVQTRASSRPLVEAFGPLAGPSAGKSFSRPIITDPILDAATAAEKTDVTDTLGVTGIDVTYSFVKRAANISAEAIAYTSPAVLQVVAQDLARAYARGTEAAVATVIGALGGTATDISADVNAGLYDAAADIYSAVGVLPDTLVLSPDQWAVLGGLKATDGRPLFPYLGQTNTSGTADGATSFGMNVLGLRPVVSWALPTGKAILIASEFVETYEAHKMNMTADEPTILGVALGLGGSIAAVSLAAGASKALDLVTGP